MIIYKDIISGDELFTDACQFEVFKDVLYKVKCTLVNETETGDYNTGANASAEEAAEDTEAAVKQGLDVVIQNRLVEAAPFGRKKDYLLCMKEYLGRVKAKISEEDYKELSSKLTPALKDLLADFKELVFYSGESNDPEAMLAILCWEDDQSVPYIYFIKQGLEAEKA